MHIIYIVLLNTSKKIIRLKNNNKIIRITKTVSNLSTFNYMDNPEIIERFDLILIFECVVSSHN